MTRSVRASLLALSIAALPLTATAAGLGQINVFSGLGQPLRAEIQISASAQELQSLSAKIASAEAFRRANLSYGSAVSAIRVSVDTGARRPVIRLSSDRPINEPFVDLLVELNWANGQLLREYTFLLDPVDIVAPKPIAASVATPAAAPAPRAAAAPARTAAAAPAARQAPDSYRVRRGDTMHRIANSLAPGGVTLEQMLIALQRANPQAFDGGNINRLRAGAVLDVPSADSVRSIDAGAARREVRAQAADFDAYRRGLASAVVSRPAAPAAEAGQESAGRIVPKVEEPQVAADSGDQVRVAQETAAGEGDAVSRLQALEEELSSRTAALDEANARLAQLERSVLDLQRLLELQSGTMGQLQAGAEGSAAQPDVAAGAATEADAQTAAGAAPAADVASEAEGQTAPADTASTQVNAAEAPTPAPDAPAAEESPAPQAAPVTPQPAQAPQPAPAPAPQAAPAPKPAAAPVPPPAPSFLETLLADPTVLYGGGGILALLLAYAGLKTRQRRKEAEIRAADASLGEATAPADSQSVFSGTGGQSVDTGATSIMHTDFSQTGLSSIDTDEGVDPVAEADVYMAYGRDVQAEEILQDALKADPGRAAIYLKLLEIYAQRRNSRQFETVAGELFARTGGQGRDWEKAAALGRKLDPENPLYSAEHAGAGAASMPAAGSSATGGAAAPLAAGAAAVGVAATLVTDAAASAPAPDESASGHELSSLDFTTSSPVDVTHSQLRDTWTLPGELDKALGGDVDAPESAAEPDVVPAEEISELDAGVIDFELDLADDAEAAPEQAAAAAGAAAADEAMHFDPLEAGDAQAADAGLVFDLDIDEPATQPGEAPGVAPEQSRGLAFDLDSAPVAAAAVPDQAAFTEDPAALASSLDFELPDMDLGQPGEPMDLAATVIADDAARQAGFGEADADALSFDLPEPEAATDTAPASVASSPAVPEVPVVDLEKTSFDNSLLDFDFELDTPAAPELPASAPAGLDLTSIDLDLDNLDVDEAPAPAADIPASMAETQFDPFGVEPAAEAPVEAGEPDSEESETKLELARAYEEMGDNEGALELLQEVLAEGSARQQGAARDMIARLS